MTEKLELSHEEQYEVSIQGIQAALQALHDRIGPIPVSVLEGALGYHVSVLIDHYPVEEQAAAAEKFCDGVREGVRLRLN